MNQRQKNKFHKAIKSLSDLMLELNSGCESWELHYSNSDCKFSLYKLQFNGSQKEIEQDDTNFPWMYMELKMTIKELKKQIRQIISEDICTTDRVEKLWDFFIDNVDTIKNLKE